MLTQNTKDQKTLSEISHSLQEKKSFSEKDLDEMVLIYRRNAEEKGVAKTIAENIGVIGEIIEKDRQPQNIKNVSDFSSKMIEAFFLTQSDSASVIANQQKIITSMDKILSDPDINLKLNRIKNTNLSSKKSQYLLMILCQRTQNNAHSYKEIVDFLQDSTKDNPMEFIERCVKPSDKAPEMTQNIYKESMDNDFRELLKSESLTPDNMEIISRLGLKDAFDQLAKKEYPEQYKIIKEYISQKPWTYNVCYGS